MIALSYLPCTAARCPDVPMKVSPVFQTASDVLTAESWRAKICLHDVLTLPSKAGKEDSMSFGGNRAVVMIGALVVLGVAVFKFGFPGWVLPVGLVVTGAVIKGTEKSPT